LPAIIKPSRVSVAHQSEPTRDGALTTVSAYVLVDLSDTGRLLTEQALWPMVADQMPNGAIFDKGQLKPKAELIVAGSALSPTEDPVESVHVSVRFGAFQKQVRVFGDRYWVLTDKGVQMSRPVPFQAMSVGDVQAFGGKGSTANPRGKGLGAGAILDAGIDAPLPNVETPSRLIKSINDQPLPVHFGPLPPDDPSRLGYLGTYDQHWIDHVSPLKPDDFNPLYHCDAPPDQRFDGFFEGGESFSVKGMSRGPDSISGTLPRLTTRCFYQLGNSDGLVETAMRCDTVTLFPNVRKATLAFRGLIKGRDRFAEDITAIMVALEDKDAAPRKHAHYSDVFQKRTSKDEAHKHALSDFQLMPQVDPEVIEARREAKLEKAAADRQKFRDNQAWATRKMLEDEGLPGDLLPPVQADILDDLPLIAQPTAEEIENGDLDMAELLDDIQAVEDALLEKRDREMVRAELQRRAVLAVTPPGLVTPNMKTPVVDEDLLAKYPDVELEPELLEGLQGVSGQLSSLPQQERLENPGKPADVDTFDAEDALSDEDIESAYQKAAARALKLPEGSLLADFRTALQDIDLTVLDDVDEDPAQPADPSSDPFDLMLAELTSQADGKAAGGSAFPLEKKGNLLEALTDRADALEPAGFEPPTGEGPAGAAHSFMKTISEQLESAEQTVDESMAFARRNAPTPLFPIEELPKGIPVRLGALIAGKLDEGHDFKGADLAGADLRGVDFSGLDLGGTYFEKADLTGARFAGANLSGAVFAGALLDGADFSDTDLTEANLSKVSAKNLRLDGARLQDLLIYQSDFSGASGTRVNMEKVRFIEATLDGLQLRQSQVTDCQFLSGSASGFTAKNSRLLRTMFVMLPMTAADLSGSDLERVAFMEVKAPGANCKNGKWQSVGFMGACNLAASRFDGLSAADSSFNTSEMAECCFLRAKGNGCFFNACNLQANDFRLSSFRNSLFGRSNFEGSDFFGANFFMAALTGANLQHCSMRSANLYAADFLEAKLTSCDFTGANLGMTLMGQPAHA